jgi:hypothetical protein
MNNVEVVIEPFNTKYNTLILDCLENFFLKG